MEKDPYCGMLDTPEMMDSLATMLVGEMVRDLLPVPVHVNGWMLGAMIGCWATCWGLSKVDTQDRIRQWSQLHPANCVPLCPIEIVSKRKSTGIVPSSTWTLDLDLDEGAIPYEDAYRFAIAFASKSPLLIKQVWDHRTACQSQLLQNHGRSRTLLESALRTGQDQACLEGSGLLECRADLHCRA